MKTTNEIISMLPARIQEKFKVISVDETETITLIVLAHAEDINMFKIVEYAHGRDELKVVTIYREEVEALAKNFIGKLQTT